MVCNGEMAMVNEWLWLMMPKLVPSQPGERSRETPRNVKRMSVTPDREWGALRLLRVLGAPATPVTAPASCEDPSAPRKERKQPNNNSHSHNQLL